MRLQIYTQAIWRPRVPSSNRVRSSFPQTTRALIFAGLTAIGALTSGSTFAGDIQQGEKLYKACKACHQIGEGARNGVGPHLDGLFGRVAGSIDGFKYSNAMKAKGEDGLVWDEASLDQYLAKPRAFVPGTRMSYLGMKKPEDRTAIIAYLKAQSVAAPSVDPTAAAPARAEIGSAAMQIEGDAEYGEYLSSECVTCHQLSGHADGIPSIVGWPNEAFIRALFEYKSNIRTNQVMQNMTLNLGNEEIAALAAYFGSLDPK
ncbi:c-type cytochrome [Roseibium sediminis]|uniref:c-type cytochrome n=1 Tax=Roseibium sediminis TaxID=1775174 RepID=UPI00123E1A92|nr:c-type cytochrome [Roseibium sediminis]